MKSLRKYGVGSCGPRGFYGTVGERAYHTPKFFYYWQLASDINMLWV